MPFFLKALVALFTIVDPIGLVPVVIALTFPFGALALGFSQGESAFRFFCAV
jgi:MarC family integral membrane protein